MRDFNRGRNSRGRGDREMFDAVCDECGDNCKVPFKPTGNKPIFCSHCFENQGGSDSRRDRGRDRGRDRDRSFSRPDSREREMFDAICDECGSKCKIPFKPSTDKPIFCSDCFAKKNEGRNRGSRDNDRGRDKGADFKKQFQVINEKLDEILQNLSLVKTKKVIKKASPKKPKTKKVIKKASPKKPKKKVVKKVTKKKAVKKKK